jgi:hypothetical protein
MHGVFEVRAITCGVASADGNDAGTRTTEEERRHGEYVACIPYPGPSAGLVLAVPECRQAPVKMAAPPAGIATRPIAIRGGSPSSADYPGAGAPRAVVPAAHGLPPIRSVSDPIDGTPFSARKR